MCSLNSQTSSASKNERGVVGFAVMRFCGSCGIAVSQNRAVCAI